MACERANGANEKRETKIKNKTFTIAAQINYSEFVKHTMSERKT